MKTNDYEENHNPVNQFRVPERQDFVVSLLDEFSADKFKSRMFAKIDEFLNFRTASELKKRINAIDASKTPSK